MYSSKLNEKITQKDLPHKIYEAFIQCAQTIAPPYMSVQVGKSNSNMQPRYSHSLITCKTVHTELPKNRVKDDFSTLQNTIRACVRIVLSTYTMYIFFLL